MDAAEQAVSRAGGYLSSPAAATLSDDHPDTLGSATNLAHDLRALGHDEEAGELE